MPTFFDSWTNIAPSPSAYVETDLSTYGVTGNSIAIFRIDNVSGSDLGYEIRTTGSTDNTSWDYLERDCQTEVWVLTDSDGHVDIRVDNTSVDVYLIGYFSSSEVTGVVNKTEYTPGSAGSYQTITVSDADASSLALMRIQRSADTYGAYLRPIGSSADRYGGGGNVNNGVFAALDSSKQSSCKVESITAVNVMYDGCVKSSFVNLKTNPVLINASSVYPTWTDLDIDSYDTVPSDAVAVLLEVYGSGYLYGLRHKGCTTSIIAESYIESNYHIVKLDSGNTIEYNSNSANLDFFIWGYIVSGGVTIDVSATLPLLIVDAESEHSLIDSAATLPLLAVRAGIGAHMTLPLLTAASAATLEGHNVTATLPTPTIEAESASSPYITVSSTLPLLSVSSTKSHSINTTVTFPQPEIDAIALTGKVQSVDLALPPIQVDSFAKTIVTIDTTIEIPLLTANGKFGHYVSMTFPLIEVVSEAVQSPVWTGIVTLPVPKLSGTSISSHVINSDIALPKLRAAADVTTGRVYNGDVIMPILLVEGQAYTGVSWAGSTTIPLMQINSVAHEVVDIDVSIGIPLPVVEASIYAIITDSSNVYLLNLKTGAVWQYTGFGFDSIAKIGDYYYGAKDTGIYRITGTQDDGENIDASIKTGKMDLDRSLLKRVNDIYLSLNASGDGVNITTTGDKADSNSYESAGNTTGFNTVHVNHGKGKKARYWEFQVENVNGSNVKFNDLEILFNILGKKR